MNQTIDTPQNITPEIKPLHLESNEAAFYFYYQIYRDLHNCNEEHLSEYMLRLTNGASFNIISQIVYFMICFFGLVLNILTVYIFLKYSNRKKTSNIYLVHLSVTDMLFLLHLLPIQVQHILERWPFNNFICSITHSADLMQQIANSLFLSAIALDRLLLVFNDRLRTAISAWITASCIWFFTFCFSLLPLHNSKVSDSDFMVYGKLSTVCYKDDSRFLDAGESSLIIFVMFSKRENDNFFVENDFLLF